MKLRDLQEHWNAFGDQDPLWAILTNPERKGGRWDIDEFFRVGEDEITVILRQVDSLGIELRRGRALDFGCGVGRLTQALGLHFEEVWGVDIAPSMIRLAQQYNRRGERCRYELNPAPDLRRFADHTFDFVYSSLVLQHMRPGYTKRYLGEFLRVLSPGGCLVFRLPSEPREQPGALRRWLDRLYWFWRDSMVRLGRRLEPRMEMYGISRPQVLDVIACHGGETVTVVDDGSAGPTWNSFLYFVRKPAGAGSHTPR